jgi:hypothetical protein
MAEITKGLLDANECIENTVICTLILVSPRFCGAFTFPPQKPILKWLYDNSILVGNKFIPLYSGFTPVGDRSC